MKFFTKLRKITRKSIKISVLIIILIFAIFLSLILIIEFTFPENLLRKELRNYLQENYQLQSDFSSINISIFSGIELNDFKITEYNQQVVSSELISFNKLILHYSFIDLFSKRLTINSFELKNPKLKLIKRKNGTTNLENILNRFSRDDKKTQKKEKSSNSSTDIKVELTDFLISNVSIDYFDEKTKDNIELNNLTLIVPKVKLTNQKVEAEAKIVLSDNNFNVDMAGNKFNLNPELEINTQFKDNILDFNLNLIIDNFKIDKIEVINFTGKISEELSLSSAGSLNLDKKYLDIAFLRLNIFEILKYQDRFRIDFASSPKISSVKSASLNLNLGKAVTFSQTTKFRENLKDLIINKGQFKIDFNNYFVDLKNKIKLKTDAKVKLNAQEVSYQKYSLRNLEQELKTQFTLDTLVSIKNVDFYFKVAQVMLSDLPINRVEDLNLRVKPYFKGAILPDSLELSLDFSADKIKCVNHDLKVSLQKTLTLEELNELSSTDLLKLLDIKINNNISELDISDILNNKILKRGKIDLKQQIIFNNNKFRIKNSIPVQSLVVNENNTNDLTIVETDTLKLIASGYFNPDFNSVIVDLLDLEVFNLFEVKLESTKFDLIAKKIEASEFSANIDFPEVLKIISQSQAFQSVPLDLASGDFTIKLNDFVFSSSDVLPEIKKGNIALNLTNIKYDIYSVEKLNFSENFSVKAQNADLNLAGNIVVENPEGEILRDFQDYLSSIKINHSLNVNLTDFSKPEIYLNIFKIEVPDLFWKLFINGRLSISDKNLIPDFNFKINNQIKLQNYSFLNKVKGFSGELNQRINLQNKNMTFSLLQKLNIDELNSEIILDSLGQNVVKLENLSGTLPIELLAEVNVNKEKNFVINLPSFPPNSDKEGIKVKSITYDTPKLKTIIKDFGFNFNLHNNLISLGNFTGETLGGNFKGDVKVDGGVVKIDNSITIEDILRKMKLSLTFTFSGINTGIILKDKKAVAENSKDLNINAKLNLNGLSLKDNYKFNGQLNLSRLSEKDARNLLDFLEKNTKDQSISMLKNTLAFFPGIKLKLFSFKLKDNFLSTRIYLYKPWYLVYFPLAEQISLSKQSVSFYLNKYVK